MLKLVYEIPINTPLLTVIFEMGNATVVAQRHHSEAEIASSFPDPCARSEGLIINTVVQDSLAGIPGRVSSSLSSLAHHSRLEF